MNDDPAQSSNNSDGGYVAPSHQGQSSQTLPVDQPLQQPLNARISSPPGSPLPHKEYAPINEHIQVTDASESVPELQQELKEHGVEAKRDEAHLELTREHQNVGMQHSPASQPISSVVQEEQKPEFPMTYVQAEEEEKKGSVWNSIRWLATYVLRQMKIKKLAEEAVK